MAQDTLTWSRLLPALESMSPLIERLEVRLNNASEEFQSIYVEGGDFPAARQSSSRLSLGSDREP